MAQISKSQPMRPAEIELVEQVNENTTNVATLTAGLANEITDRTNADTTLQNNIDSERNARVAADNTLTTNLASEVSARQSADTTLQNNINAEATTRADADTALQGNIDTVAGNLTTETTNRETADTGLSDRITTLEDKFPVTNTDLGTNAVEEGNIADEQVTSSKLSAGIQSQLSFLASVPSIQYGTSNSVDVTGNSSTDVTVSFGTTKTEAPLSFAACSIPTVILRAW